MDFSTFSPNISRLTPIDNKGLVCLLEHQDQIARLNHEEDGWHLSFATFHSDSFTRKDYSRGPTSVWAHVGCILPSLPKEDVMFALDQALGQPSQERLEAVQVLLSFGVYTPEDLQKISQGHPVHRSLGRHTPCSLLPIQSYGVFLPMTLVALKTLLKPVRRWSTAQHFCPIEDIPFLDCSLWSVHTRLCAIDRAFSWLDRIAVPDGMQQQLRKNLEQHT